MWNLVDLKGFYQNIEISFIYPMITKKYASKIVLREKGDWFWVLTGHHYLAFNIFLVKYLFC